MYTALVGVVALALIGAYVLGQRVLDRLVAGLQLRRVVRAAAVVALAGVVGGLALLTLDRNRDYWSEERIWQDTVEKRPDNPRARLNYGVLLAAEGRYPEAEAHLREALRLKEPVAKAHQNLGSILCSQGRFEEGAHLEAQSRSIPSVKRARESRRSVWRAWTPAQAATLLVGRRGTRQLISPELARWVCHIAGR
jgi:tetratricopeptide (TPR) repeat protein